MIHARILVALAVALTTVPALAFEPFRAASGQQLSWPRDQGPSAICAALQDADAVVDAWDGALVWWTRGGLQWPVDVTSASPCIVDPGDGSTAVAALTSWSETYGASASTVGFTIHTWEREDGRILDADIVLNEERFTFDVDARAEGSLDLARVVGHEMGHVLGLGHPCGDPGSSLPSCFDLEREQLVELERALMFRQQSVGEKPLALSEDDAAAIEALLQPAGVPSAELELVRGSLCRVPSSGLLERTSEPELEAALSTLRPGEDPSAGWPDLERTGEGALLLRYDDGRRALVPFTSLDTCVVEDVSVDAVESEPPAPGCTCRALTHPGRAPMSPLSVVVCVLWSWSWRSRR